MSELRCTNSNLRKVLRTIRPGDKLFAITNQNGGGRHVTTYHFRKVMGQASAGNGAALTPDAVLKREKTVYTADPCVVPDQRGPGIAHLPGQEGDCCRRGEWRKYEKAMDID